MSSEAERLADEILREHAGQRGRAPRETLEEGSKPDVGGRPPRLSRADEFELYRYRMAGVAQKTVADMFHVSVPTVKRIMRRFREHNARLEQLAREFRAALNEARDST